VYIDAIMGIDKIVPAVTCSIEDGATKKAKVRAERGQASEKH
jgi:hypothetical protein